jgi:hypothetical protein
MFLRKKISFFLQISSYLSFKICCHIKIVVCLNNAKQGLIETKVPQKLLDVNKKSGEGQCRFMIALDTETPVLWICFFLE